MTRISAFVYCLLVFAILSFTKTVRGQIQPSSIDSFALKVDPGLLNDTISSHVFVKDDSIFIVSHDVQTLHVYELTTGNKLLQRSWKTTSKNKDVVSQKQYKSHVFVRDNQIFWVKDDYYDKRWRGNWAINALKYQQREANWQNVWKVGALSYLFKPTISPIYSLSNFVEKNGNRIVLGDRSDGEKLHSLAAVFRFKQKNNGNYKLKRLSRVGQLDSMYLQRNNLIYLKLFKGTALSVDWGNGRIFFSQPHSPNIQVWSLDGHKTSEIALSGKKIHDHSLPKLSGENFNPFAAIHYFVETFRYREIYYDRSNGQILRTYQLGVDDTLGKEWKNLGSFFCSAEPTEKDLQRLKQAKYRPTYLQIATPEGQLLADVPVPAGSRILKADESGIWLIRKKPDPQGRLWVYRYAYQPGRARR